MSQIISNSPDILTQYETAIVDRLKQFLTPYNCKVLASYKSETSEFDTAAPPIIYVTMNGETADPSQGTENASQMMHDTWAVNLKVRDFSPSGKPSEKIYPILTLIKSVLRYEYPLNSGVRSRWTPWTHAGYFDFSSALLMEVRDRYAFYQILFALKPRVE